MKDILFLAFYITLGLFLYFVQAGVIIWIIAFILMFFINKSVRGNKET